MSNDRDLPRSLFKGQDIDIDKNFIAINSEVFIGDQFTEDIEEYRRLVDHFDTDRMKSLISYLSSRAKHLTKSSNVLEIGSGFGNYSVAFLRSDLPYQTYIINDLSRQMLEETNKNVSEIGKDLTNVYFLEADIADDIFKPNTFDLIFGGSVLHHIVDYKKFLETIYTLLKPSGIFIVSEPFSNPYLMAAITMQLSLYIAEVQKEPYSESEKKLIDQYCTNIHSRANQLFTQEIVESIDDKHLFDHEQIIQHSKKIGFSSCTIETNEFASKDSGARYQSFINEIFHGLEIEPKYNVEVVTKLYDSLLPDLVTKVMPPHEYIVLKK